MADLFDNIIICNNCGTRMSKCQTLKNRILIRTALCKKCGKKDFHPLDMEKYKQFQQLRQKPFRVKLRMVGNSYAVSIPREIIDFLGQPEKIAQEVEMQFSELDKIMLSFQQKVFKKPRLLRQER